MSSESLVVFQEDELKKDLEIHDPSEIHASAEADPELDKKANEVVDQLLAVDTKNSDQVLSSKAAVENMGSKLQKEAAYRSHMLREPIKKLSERGEDGGSVGNSLIDLKMKVEELDPGKFDFEPGWFTRVLGFLPFIGTPIKRYFTRYESASTVIDAIIRSLKNGKEQLVRDNKTLIQDQKVMRDLTIKLEKAIKLAQLIDEKLDYRLHREITPEDPRAKFIQEELLFPLRQRIQDLQQQLLVNQQGVLSIEMIIRNNKELVRGVDRAIHVTVSALQVGVTLALALANQKITLDKIEAVNETTSNLIAGTAARLKQQGTQIHKQAASAQLDINALKSAFNDINAALQDISNFRRDALPRMAQSIVEMDKLSSQAGKAIDRLEDARKAAPKFIEIEIED